MKKSKVLAAMLFICIGAALFAKETGDVYEPTATPIPMPKKKKSTNILTKIFGKKLSDPVLLTESSLFRYNYFGTNVKEEDIDIMYFPQEHQVAIAFESKKNRFLRFDERAQNALKLAFYSYEDQFDAKTLDSRKKKHLKEYGTTIANYSIDPIIGHEEYKPEITFGYVFVDKSPYFVISIPETVSQSANPVDPDKTKQSSLIRLLFNRNQMKTLIGQFSEEKILEALNKAEVDAMEKESTEEPKAAGETNATEEPKAEAATTATVQQQ